MSRDRPGAGPAAGPSAGPGGDPVSGTSPGAGIVVDSSALMALLLGEPEAAAVANALEATAAPVIGAPTYVEAMIVTESRLGAEGVLSLFRILSDAEITTVAFDADDADAAVDAWRRYGRGRHPARLNLGDCMSYAVAVRRSQPLLYVGGDFDRTDVVSALDSR